MNATVQRLFPIVFAAMLTLFLCGLTGCSGSQTDTPSNDDADGNTPTEKIEVDKDDKEAKDSKDAKQGAGKEEDDDDVIVAGTVDTSSKYAFSVDGAFVGVDEYSEIPEVILICEFTNNSDEKISFSSALDATAFQGSHKLSSAYLRGAGSYNYDNIGPGETLPVLIGWELVSADENVELSVTDRYHYAHEEVFSQTYTIDELIENTKKYAEEYGGIVDEDQAIAV